MTKNHHRIEGVVLRGDQVGRTLGFPTVNFDPLLLDANLAEGVYAAKVQIAEKQYLGALYFGPRLTLGETNRVLEIHLLDFEDNLYGKSLSFIIQQFVRPPRDFASVEELKDQLASDVLAVRRLAS